MCTWEYKVVCVWEEYKCVTYVFTGGQKPGRMLGVYHFPLYSLETVSL